MIMDSPLIDKSENEKVENCMNAFSPNTIDLEENINKLKKCENKIEKSDAPVDKNIIYHTLTINNKEILIYQYKTFPKNFLNSVYKLLSSELSEPYNIFLLKTILNQYPEITLMSLCNEQCVGTVICKITTKRKSDELITFGYICSYLLCESIKLMQKLYNIDEVQLEAEANNDPTLCFYEKNGFIRVKRKPFYYLSGFDAFKLKKIL
ncbi:N-acetyltransferase, GNAT family, putative [Hepatocystis sp. ex Piliocolobus tephrosceles]|nr:N-acetyltransferase, GNAT family, putative [Hepatocystis sp. ex Piliocolobus tephrosceles]